MNRLTRYVSPTLLLCGVLAAQEAPAVDLDVTRVGDLIHTRVLDPVPVFTGAILWSLTPDLRHSLHGLPPLLADGIVLGIGAGHHGEYGVWRSLGVLDHGFEIYAQGVVLDAWGLRSTTVLALTEQLHEQ